MGVLDDAIREHLELKRQHGASADEVSQQEQEALGALQGQPVEPAGAMETPEAVETTEAAGAVEQPEAPEPELLEPEAEPEPELELPPAPRSGDTPPRGFEEIPDEPGPADDAPLPDHDAPLPAEDAGDEDVLEETPEFLQETPEHDRLWFEQKPPREFDFDDD